MSLGSWDYVSLTTLVTGTCAVGLYQAFKARNSEQTKDFLMSNRSLNLFSLVMSIVATIASAGHVSGTPFEIYAHGLIFCAFAISSFVCPAMVATLFLPVFYQLDKHTIFEYLELRFSSKVRLGFSVIQTIKMLLLSSFFIYAAALVLSQVTNLHLWAAVWLIGGVCTLYTSLGGFKAVVWTDVGQQLVVYAILALLAFKGLNDLGGMSAVWDKITSSGRNNILTWTPKSTLQYSIWTFVIGNPFHQLGLYAISPPMMQRCQSLKTLKQAKITLIGGGFGYFLCQVLIFILGVNITARYFGCDPLIMGQVKKRDQMVTLFATEVLSLCKGLNGVFIAALLCATISTLSSYLNSLAAVSMADHVRMVFPNLTTNTVLRLSKLITIAHGLLSIALVGIIENLGRLNKILYSITGLMSGPTVTIFTIGMLFPFVNTKAAVIGTLASMVLPWWVTIGHLTSSAKAPHLPFIASGCSNSTDVIYDASQTSSLQVFYSVPPNWFVLWSLVVGLSVSLIAAKIIGFQDSSKVDPGLLFPFVRRFIKPRDQQVDETEVKLNPLNQPE